MLDSCPTAVYSKPQTSHGWPGKADLTLTGPGPPGQKNQGRSLVDSGHGGVLGGGITNL